MNSSVMFTISHLIKARPDAPRPLLTEGRSKLYTVCVQCTMKRPPLVRIDLESPVPTYRQIVDALRIHLVEGQLAPGDVLPSVRRLALELGIHFNTVAQAYRELAEEGWLDLKHGRRATVLLRGVPAAASRGTQRDFERRLREMVAEMRAGGLSSAAIAAQLLSLAERLKS
jgi:GntR family transcriptional regulator